MIGDLPAQGERQLVIGIFALDLFEQRLRRGGIPQIELPTRLFCQTLQATLAFCLPQNLQHGGFALSRGAELALDQRERTAVAFGINELARLLENAGL